MPIKVNYQKLKFEVENFLPNSRQVRNAVIKLAEGRFHQVKEEFLEKYDEHEVTQEIAAGIESESDILGGVGSLFGFIGFQAGSNPTQKLYQFLDDHITIDDDPRFIKSRLVFQFTVNIPTKDSIADATPMPWGTDRSWVFAIESGISGLNQFLSIQSEDPKYIDLGKSRSGGGVQIKKVLFAGGFTAQQYMSNLLSFLRSEINGL